MKLRPFSLTLTLATTHPSRQDRMSTSRERSTASSRLPITPAGPGRRTIQYTITAGSITTPENISPIRYTPSSRAARMYRTGMGRERSRSLSRAR